MPQWPIRAIPFLPKLIICIFFLLQFHFIDHRENEVGLTVEAPLRLYM